VHPFNALHEQFRDHTRDDLCAALLDLGIQARMGERERAEEKFTFWRGRSLGIIDITDGSVRWVNIKMQSLGSNEGGGSDLYIEFGIPDSRVESTFPKVHIETVRVKSFPLFGRVIAMQWKGNDFGLGTIDRLASDVSLHKPIMGSYDVEIEAYPEHGCWILTVKGGFASDWENLSHPSRDLWDCYQSIGKHLLDTPAPPTLA